MATTQLQVYNEALRMCGERKLSSLTENRQPRFYLDDVWANNAAQHCLEKGQWTFAMRTSKLTYDPSFSPDFGYRRVFKKANDWAATSQICSDEFFNVPILRYADEAGYWLCDLETIYVQYVSTGPTWGMDLGKWPSAFADYVSAHMAVLIAPSLSGLNIDKLEKNEKKNMVNAKSRDAQSQPTKFPAEGSWSRARHGSYTGRDGGNRGNLIG